VPINIFRGNSRKEIKLRFFIAFASIGAFFFILFAIINIIVKDYVPAIIEIALTLLIFLLIIKTLKSRNLFWATNFGLIPIIVISLINFLNGGFNNTGIYLTFGLPLVCLFLAGRRKGTYAVLFYLFCITLIQFVLTDYISRAVEYDNFTFLIYLVGFLIVYVMTWLYHTAWNLSEEVVENDKKYIEQSKNDLERQVKELEKVKSELQQSLKKTQEANEELRRVNRVIIGRELKMAELKDRIRELEKKTP